MATPWQRGAGGQALLRDGLRALGLGAGSGTYVDDLRTVLRQRVICVAVVALVALLLAGYLFFSFYKVMGGGGRGAPLPQRHRPGRPHPPAACLGQ